MVTKIKAEMKRLKKSFFKKKVNVKVTKRNSYALKSLNRLFDVQGKQIFLRPRDLSISGIRCTTANRKKIICKKVTKFCKRSVPQPKSANYSIKTINLFRYDVF